MFQFNVMYHSSSNMESAGHQVAQSGRYEGNFCHFKLQAENLKRLSLGKYLKNLKKFELSAISLPPGCATCHIDGVI